MKNQRENLKPPSLSLPKGGGAIRGIGEKFTTNPATGTGTLTVLSDTSLNHTVAQGPDNYYYIYVVFSHEDAGSNLRFTSATIVYEY